MAGVTEKNVEYIAKAMHDVTKWKRAIYDITKKRNLIHDVTKSGEVNCIFLQYMYIIFKTNNADSYFSFLKNSYFIWILIFYLFKLKYVKPSFKMFWSNNIFQIIYFKLM